MNQIIAVLRGGLGNQLFIYCAARRLAIVSGAELVLDEISGFEKDVLYRRSSCLDNFAINVRSAPRSQCLGSHSGVRRIALNFDAYFRSRDKKRLLVQRKQLFDPSLLEFRSKRSRVYLDGYWQSEQYFSDIEPIIRRDLKGKTELDEYNESFASTILESKSTGIHVRLFDDDAAEFEEMKEYYRRAVRFIESRCPGSVFYVFSEDMVSAKKLLDIPQDRVHFIAHNTGELGPYLDLSLMRQCKNFIIAKSTYSWWGAWLSEREGKIIVAPKQVKDRGVSLWGFLGQLPEEWSKL